MNSAPRAIPPARIWCTPEWLAERLGKPGIAVVDGSYYLPATKRDPRAEYLAGAYSRRRVLRHRRGRRHSPPICRICCRDPDQFGEAVGTLGIGKDDTIVVYDGRA